ncbi:MAG TPA: phage holin family protein [Anaerohalosphaeraceae bacterium]|jgi:cytochrome b subunit of formate dehydrogenase|nr:phage holin family protein [Anaerohalosphaeraceae bacterium]HRT49945.1 phage holin family protein [Anaerohalosphaeraceae bacterium]HRT85757.1 phage holin family protein [Anaerohalosphaeraceae bacterium]
MGNIRDVVNIARDIGQIISDLTSLHLKQLTELYREMLTKLLSWLVIALAAIFLAITGLVMILWGVHLLLSMVTGPAASAFILGIFLLLFAVIIYLVGRGIVKG